MYARRWIAPTHRLALLESAYPHGERSYRLRWGHGGVADVGGGRAESHGHASGQDALPGPGPDEAGPGGLLLGGGRRRAARRTRASDDPQAVREGHRRGGVLSEAGTGQAARLDRGGRAQV